jgi:RimJ/RimL family protein N-acetyltransferase
VSIEVRPVDFETLGTLREAFRAEADCQIVRDSILPRRLAAPYVVLRDGAVAAYGGIWLKYFPERVVEFYVLEGFRDGRRALFEAFLSSTGAKEIEAQTNMPAMLELLRELGSEPVEEKILFRDGGPTSPTSPAGWFRRRRAEDEGPEGDWVVEMDGEVVAGGGMLTHYNPPWADLFMEVAPSWRRRGVGSYLVQELRRVCREAGLVPAARCDPDNVASWRTLQRGGMAECGRLLAASVKGG